MLDIVSKMSNCRWLFDDLVPLFNSKLDQSLSSQLNAKEISNLAIFQKTYFSYQQVLLSNPNGSSSYFLFENYDSYRNIFKITVQSNKEAHYNQNYINKVNAALEFLKEHSRYTYDLFEKWMSGFVFVDNKLFLGASHPHLWGLITLSSRIGEISIEDIASSIVHEMAHHEVFLLNLVDKLVNEKFAHNMVHAPLQGKKRPPIARLHSCHALLRMLEFGHGSRISEYKIKLDENSTAFRKNEMTDLSMRIINEIYIPSSAAFMRNE